MMFPKTISFSLLFAAMLLLHSCHHTCTYGTADLTAFKGFVLSPALRDSMSNNTVCLGMPYSTVRMIFGGCSCDTSIAVASSGSRQPLDETEGLYSHFHDPNIQMYLNKYKTSQGNLYIWYGNMNFYRAEVSKNDSLFLYSPGSMEFARVSSLSKPQMLRADRSLPVGSYPYAEIHSREHVGSASYWYHLDAIDSVTIKQQSQTTADYPILHMELGTTPVSSFHWK